MDIHEPHSTGTKVRIEHMVNVTVYLDILIVKHYG